MDLSGLDLSFTDLRAANLTDSNLGGTDLSHSDLRTADLTNAELTGAVLTDAQLHSANFTGTLLVPTAGFGSVSPVGSGHGPASWAPASSLPGATPGSCTPAGGVDFPLGDSTAECEVVDDGGGAGVGSFPVTVQEGVVNGCTVISNPTETVHTECPGADLSGEDLSGAVFGYANLVGANLIGADLHYADFSGADLAGVDLRAVYAYETNFEDSDLTSTRWGGGPGVFYFVNLTGATVNGADLFGVYVTSVARTSCPDGTLAPATTVSSNYPYIAPPPYGCGPPPPL